MRGSLAGSDTLVKNEADKFYASDITPKLNVLHGRDRHFQSVVNHNNYRLLDSSQTYHGKMAAQTGKYVKRKENGDANESV